MDPGVPAEAVAYMELRGEDPQWRTWMQGFALAESIGEVSDYTGEA